MTKRKTTSNLLYQLIRLMIVRWVVQNVKKKKKRLGYSKKNNLKKMLGTRLRCLYSIFSDVQERVMLSNAANRGLSSKHMKMECAVTCRIHAPVMLYE
jgi:hypothetical protein